MEVSIHQQLMFISTLFVLVLPLLSSLLAFSIKERYAWLVNVNAPILLLVSLIVSLYASFTGWNAAPYAWSISWFTIGESSVELSFLLTRSTLLMMVVVSAVSFLVHLYSTSYMAWDENIRRYFAVLGFFTFAMQGVVLSDNLLLLFIFWELMGFASYLLIGHWTEDLLAGQASKKAFIVNRIGDLGFLVGILIVYTNLGTFSINEIVSSSSGWNWQTAAGLCIFAGVIGKSAQFPLAIWLPDAMKGPTPVSALIHAATMVAAGVYLLIRLFPIFTPVALIVIAIIGVITALFGAISALHQFDIKKILAYSTISQLGLMVTAIGVGAPEAAFLHLLTHAFFKACLFLSAGAVIQSYHQAQKQLHDHTLDAQDIRNFGGLKNVLPVTFFTFLISASSLAGIPFFSGFISKEAILHDVWNKVDNSGFYLAIFAGILITSFGTVLYAFRMFWFVFMAKPQNTIHTRMTEAPVIMRVPMIILALASLWLIISWNPFGASSRFSEQTSGHSLGWLSLASILWIALALITAYFFFRKRMPKSLILFEKGFYVDQAFSFVSVKVLDVFSATVAKFDQRIFDRTIHGGAYAYITLAHMVNWIDRFIIDGVVNLIAGISRWIGSTTRSFQGGKIQQYIFWALFAIIIFLIWSLN